MSLGQFGIQSRQLLELELQEMRIFRAGPESCSLGAQKPIPAALGIEGERRGTPTRLVRVSGSKAGLINDINWEGAAGVRWLRSTGAQS